MQRLSRNKHPRGPKRFSQRSLCFGFLGFFGILYLYVVSKFAVSTNAYLGGDYDNSSSNSNSPLGTSSSMLNGHDRNDNGNGSVEDSKLKKKKIGTPGSDLVVPDVRIPDKITTVAYGRFTHFYVMFPNSHFNTTQEKRLEIRTQNLILYCFECS